MSETPNQGSPLVGCATLLALLMVGGCAVHSCTSHEKPNSPPSASTTSPATNTLSSSDALSTTVPAGTPETPSSPTNSDNAKTEKALEQLFPVAIDHSDSASYQKEWWMVKGAVKQAGYPCAAIAIVKQNLNGTFQAACKTRIRSNQYMVFEIDPDAQTVVPLSHTES